MKEIASNKGEKVQPQVCVADLSQRKFSVNDLQVQENCSREPISGRGGCRFGDTGEKVQVTKLRAKWLKRFSIQNQRFHSTDSLIRLQWCLEITVDECAKIAKY